MNSARIVRNLLPAFLITLGLGVIGVAYASSMIPATVHLSANSNTPTPAVTLKPTPTPSPETRVTIDGHQVPVGANGSTSLSLPSGKATVVSSGGQTTVSTTSPPAGSVETVTADDGMNVSVHSTLTGGNSHSHTNVTGHDNSSVRSSSSTTTTVSGIGQRTVRIEQ